MANLAPQSRVVLAMLNVLVVEVGWGWGVTEIACVAGVEVEMSLMLVWLDLTVGLMVEDGWPVLDWNVSVGVAVVIAASLVSSVARSVKGVNETTVNAHEDALLVVAAEEVMLPNEVIPPVSRVARSVNGVSEATVKSHESPLVTELEGVELECLGAVVIGVLL